MNFYFRILIYRCISIHFKIILINCISELLVISHLILIYLTNVLYSIFLDEDYCLLFEMDFDQNELFESKMIISTTTTTLYPNLYNSSKSMDKIYSYSLSHPYPSAYNHISNLSNGLYSMIHTYSITSSSIMIQINMGFKMPIMAISHYLLLLSTE